MPGPNTCTIPMIAMAAVVVAPIMLATEPAEARRFRASLGAARSAATVARPVVRSADDVARETKRESHINWSLVQDVGLDAAQAAFDAADRSSTSSSPTGSPAPAPRAFTGSTLSRLELEACVREANTLDLQSERLDQVSAGVAQRRAAIEAMERDIEAARNRVDRSSKRSVDAFNARIEAYRQAVASFNSSVVQPAQQQQATYNRRVEKFNALCNGKSYYPSDLAAVEAKTGIKLTSK